MFYLVNYNYMNIADKSHTTVVTVSWIFPKLRSILSDPSNQDICTSRKEIPDCIEEINCNKLLKDFKYNGRVFNENYKFRLRMKMSGSNLIEFFYLAPKPVYLKCNLIVGSHKTIVTQEFQWVGANTWQFLGDYTKESMLNCGNIIVRFFVRNDKSFDEATDVYYSNQKNERECNMHKDKSAKVKMNHDLINLLNNAEMFSDVTIKSIDGVKIQAHKGILAARSPVFRAHFDHNMVESVTNVVESPFESEELQAALKYIYAADLSKLKEMPEELLMVADFYQLDELKHLCEEMLKDKLDVENVITTLEFANMYTALNLEASCWEFINGHDKEEIMQTKAWKELKSLELCKKIIEYYQ